MNVTTAELAAAIIRARDPRTSEIRFNGYNSSSLLARDLLADVENTQRVNKYAQPSPTFSETEIADALKNYGYGQTSGASLARYVAEHIEKARERAKEPEWKTGDVIKSAKSKVLVRCADGQWFRPDDGLFFADKRISRPVTVLHKGA